MAVEFQVQFTDLPKLTSFCWAVSNKLDRMTAVAMTRSAKAVQAKIKAEAPKYLDNPTRWTLNSTFVRPATVARLEAIVGFKDYASTGTPAAKYLQLQAAGGRGKPKGYEMLLRRRGLLGGGEFAIPTGNFPVRFNQYGNVSGANYVQVLSRLGSLREAGYQANATGSARSTAKRKQRDYFVATIKGTKGIWARKPQRGIVPVFIFVDQAPNFSARFPVKDIMEKTYEKAFDVEFKRAIQEQIAYDARH